MSRFAEITRDALNAQVRAFYGRARLDPDLGPIFAAIADWEGHFDLLTRFWAAVMLGERDYDGRPMPAHMRHPIRDPMFDRWLQLWGQTADELFEPELAARLKEKAAQIARGLRLGLFFRPDAASA